MPRPGEPTALIDRILANPLVGLSPWIVFSLVEGKGRLELSAGISLGTALLILCLNWLRGSSPKVLEFAYVVYSSGSRSSSISPRPAPTRGLSSGAGRLPTSRWL